MNKEKLAIIGGGIAGMSAAYFLRNKYDLTVFEKNDYIGGHSHTVDIDYHGQRVSVDTAVMIFDRQNYPNIEKLFSHLGITDKDKVTSNVSWGAAFFENETLEYSNRSPLTQWHNTFSLRSWRLFFNYARFAWLSKRAFLKRPQTLEGTTFGSYLRDTRVSQDCIDHIITPLYACIFSLAPADILAWPTLLMLGFLYRHQMLGIGLLGETPWYMLRGGTRTYVEKLTAAYKDAIRLNAPVKSVRRENGRVHISLADGTQETFDKVVIAAHANEALSMLIEPTADERSLLGAFPYTSGRKVIVHDDTTVMPRRKSAWAAFTFNDRVAALDGGFAVTYWLNLVQSIDQKYPLFLSINTDAVRKECRFAEFNYTHPTFTAGSYEAQKELSRLQGVGGIYYCGSYFSYACHEDGLLSAMALSNLLGGEIPWNA